jgi:O-antigen/teichoic acid export membrane protein
VLLSIKVTPEATADNTADLPKPAPSTAGMTTKVVKGSLWTLFGQILPLAVAFLATPFTIRLLGAEGYGALVFIALIPSYLAFADFGMGIASTKFGSEAFAKGEGDLEARIVRTASLVTLFFSVPLALLVIAFSERLAVAFNVPDILLHAASLGLKITAVAMVVNLLNGILNTPQLARLRMDVNAAVTASFRVLSLILTPVVIYLGWGLVGVALVQLGAAILTFAGHIYFSGRLLPRLYGWTIESSYIKILLNFGGGIVLSHMAVLILINAEKAILARGTSVKELGYYSVAYTLASMVTTFSGAMNQALVPAFSTLQSEEQKGHLNSLYVRGVRLPFIVVLPFVLCLSVIAGPFFYFWAGEEFAIQSTLPFYILAFGLTFNALTYSAGAAILAAGRSDVFARLHWCELVPYIIVAWLLIGTFGIIGAALAWTLRIIVDAFLQIFLARKVARVSIPPSEIRKYALLGMLMLLPFMLNVFLPDEYKVVIVAISGLFVILFLWLSWRHVLVADERTWFWGKFHSVMG